jgi:uncharacterized protein involved in type VI secretion and phage assembly
MIASGMYRAQVTDTSTFQALGKIKVNIRGINDPNSSELVSVLTPYGGLPNMGMQALPPIGATGIVMFEREDDDHPVWMGSLLQYWQTKSDKALDENRANPVEAISSNDLVLKTQYTTKDNHDLTSNKNKVENIIHLEATAITLTHVHQDNNYAYKDKAYADKDIASSFVKLTDKNITLSVRTGDNSADRTFVVDGDQNTLTMTWDADRTISIGKDVTVIKNGKSTINVQNDGTVFIDSDKIQLGGTDGTGMYWETFRDFVNAYNKHTHGTPSGPSSPPVSGFTQASSGKSKKVKLG